MFGIELDLVKKIEIGFCAAALVAAGVFAYINLRPAPDTNIASYVTEYKVPVDTHLPISATNPMDPRRSRVVTTFANHDGQLDITEFAPELNLKPAVRFRLDPHRDSYNAIQSQWEKVNKISDPARRAIAFAAYLAAEGRPQNLMNRVGLDAPQRAKALEAYKGMLDAIVLIDEDMKQGLIEPAMQDELVAALERYRAVDGDIAKDAPKKLAARKVMDAGLRYNAKVQEKRNAVIDAYVNDTYALLNDAQRKKIATAGEDLAARAFPKRGNKTAS